MSHLPLSPVIALTFASAPCKASSRIGKPNFLSDSTAQTTVVVNSATASASNDGPICAGAGNVTLTATGGGTYQWSGGLGTNATASTATAGTYTVTVTNNGCTSTAQTTVVVNNATASASNDGPVCSGATAATINLTATGGGTYAWAGSNLSSATGAATTANIPPNTLYLPN